MSQSENLDTLAHVRSDPAAYFIAKTLPAAGAATAPNTGTLGNGLAIPVPSWAINAMVYVTYADGVGATPGAGSVDVEVYVGPTASTMVTLRAVSASNINIPGAVIQALGIGGALFIGAAFSESGDTAHPGAVTVTIVFSR